MKHAWEYESTVREQQQPDGDWRYFGRFLCTSCNKTTDVEVPPDEWVDTVPNYLIPDESLCPGKSGA